MKVFSEYEATQHGTEKATKYVLMVETALLPFTNIKTISMDIIIRYLQEDGLRKASTIEAYCHALQHFVRCLKVREIIPSFAAMRLEEEISGICIRFRQESLVQEWAVHVRDRGVFI